MMDQMNVYPLRHEPVAILSLPSPSPIVIFTTRGPDSIVQQMYT